jgi:hypothetical protein
MEKERLLLAVVVVAILIGAIVVLKEPSITGFVPSTVYSQDITLQVDESQIFWLKSVDGQPLKLTSLLISGLVEGEGLASIYLYTPNDSRLLVYSNLKKKTSAMAPITGMATKELLVVPGERTQSIEVVPPDHDVVSGPFEAVCLETCILSPDVFDKSRYKMEIIVTPGTVINIKELRFTVEE